MSFNPDNKENDNVALEIWVYKTKIKHFNVNSAVYIS